MGDAVIQGERFSAVRGVLALGVVLGAARLPDRLAAAGVELAARIAPAQVAETTEVPQVRDARELRLPEQRDAAVFDRETAIAR